MRFLKFLIFLAALPVMAANVPIKNGVLQSDMNAAGYRITNILELLDQNGVPIAGSGGVTYTNRSDLAAGVIGGAGIGTNLTEYATTNALTAALAASNAALGAALSPGVIYVDATSGSDTNAGTLTAPVATLTYAQSLATNGQTVCALRGTFTESGLHKTGVSWFLNEGVTLDGGWNLTNTSDTLTVRGLGTLTNALVFLYYCTNATVKIEAATIYPTTTPGGIANFTYGTSNTVIIKADTVTGRLCNWSPADYTNAVSQVHVTAKREFLGMITGPGSSIPNSNCLVTVTAPLVRPTGNGIFNTGATVHLNGGRFSRNGTTQNTIGENIWFKNVSCQSSNTDASAAIFSTVHGNFYFENERTLISNP